MLETEVKIRVDDRKLEEIIGIIGIPNYFIQINVVYKNPTGFLRLRLENGKTIVTHKGKRLNDKFRSRPETEIVIEREEDFFILRDMFCKWGLKESLYYCKKRASFEFENCVVCLDKLMGSDYIEIEAVSEENIENLMKLFKLDKEDVEKKAYHEIVKDDKKYNSRGS